MSGQTIARAPGKPDCITARFTYAEKRNIKKTKIQKTKKEVKIMLKKQENKFTMYNAVNTFLSENEEIISSIPELKESQIAFSEKCRELFRKDELKRNATAGKAITKLRARNIAISNCMSVSAALFSLAKKKNDEELAAMSDIPRSRLEVMRDTEISEILESVYQLAYSRLDVLEPFGINAAKLENFRQSKDRFSEAFGRSQTGVVKRKGANHSINDLFKQADDILVRIDKYVKGMSNDNTEFVRHYEDLRVIRNLGIRHNKNSRNLQTQGQQQTGPLSEPPPENSGS